MNIPENIYLQVKDLHGNTLKKLDRTFAESKVNRSDVQYTRAVVANEKLSTLILALRDIAAWNDALHDKWGDPGERAKAALNSITK